MKFAKMQATGNDFVLIEAGETERDWSRLAKSMCDRHFGVGADGLILLLPSKLADLGMRMFNPDGSEAEACGNGLRCLARYAIDRGLADASGELSVETLGGIRKARARGENIQVNMGMPELKAEQIPMVIEEKFDIILDYPIVIGGEKLLLTCLSIGNPHAVFFTEETVADFPLFELGPIVENHPIFPNRVNFEVANVLARKKVRARVWERGLGETLSCGTGACAVAVAARLHDYVDSHVNIILPGGMLTVDWDGVGEVMLSGPAELVFGGEWPD
ncbi:MAG: diaminopimelate epimerase [Dehalococcoidia bacterium]|nr:MAG: diaminopimelate epimerase [Dehalococcoidia bacterium]